MDARNLTSDLDRMDDDGDPPRHALLGQTSPPQPAWIHSKQGAMPKKTVVRRRSPRAVTARPTELPNLVEGQIEELCRDLALAAKRMQQLQGQADELRTLIRQWSGSSEIDRPANR